MSGNENKLLEAFGKEVLTYDPQPLSADELRTLINELTDGVIARRKGERSPTEQNRWLEVFTKAVEGAPIDVDQPIQYVTGLVNETLRSQGLSPLEL